MIHEVTQSLEAFLKQPGLPPPLRDAAIRFDRPTDPYSIDQTTVNAFLFEVKENLELRNNEPVVRRVAGNAVIEPPPYRVACTYLVTAWPVDGPDLPQQEHQLLAQVLQLIAGTPVIPAAFLTPGLAAQEPPPPMVVVQPGGISNPAEFWSAIGNRIKPSVLVTITAALRVFPDVTAPAVITSEIRLAPDPPFFRIGGTVTDAASSPIAGASVRVVEAGRSAITGPDGRFTISALAAGNFTLRVSANGSSRDKNITVPAAGGANHDVQLT